MTSVPGVNFGVATVVYKRFSLSIMAQSTLTMRERRCCDEGRAWED